MTSERKAVDNFQPAAGSCHLGRVLWLRPQGHAYPSTIRNKVKGFGCPVGVRRTD